MRSPRFSSALSLSSDLRRAESECLGTLMRRLEGQNPDLLLFFVTPQHAGSFGNLPERLTAATGARHVVGCTGASVLGDSMEAEGRPALSIWAGSLPETSIQTSHISASLDSSNRVQFRGDLEAGETADPSQILLADPFSFPINRFLPYLEETHGGTSVVGGLASGGRRRGEHRLWLNGNTYKEGAVSISLEGAVRMETLVSQGCRPIGEPQVITACDGNLIKGMRGQQATEFLFNMMEEMDEADQNRFQRGAHVGLAIDPTLRQFSPRDLLVRNILGIHPDEGAIAIAESQLRVGQTVQFMVRDAQSASEELRGLLDERASDWSHEEAEEMGALLFTCGGRGRRLFGSDNHDAAALQTHMGPDLPLAGFFANGEIGPVKGRSFLHGFSAGIALLGAAR